MPTPPSHPEPPEQLRRQLRCRCAAARRRAAVPILPDLNPELQKVRLESLLRIPYPEHAVEAYPRRNIAGKGSSARAPATKGISANKKDPSVRSRGWNVKISRNFLNSNLWTCKIDIKWRKNQKNANSNVLDSLKRFYNFVYIHFGWNRIVLIVC